MPRVPGQGRARRSEARRKEGRHPAARSDRRTGQRMGEDPEGKALAAGDEGVIRRLFGTNGVAALDVTLQEAVLDELDDLANCPLSATWQSSGYPRSPPRSGEMLTITCSCKVSAKPPRAGTPCRLDRQLRKAPRRSAGHYQGPAAAATPGINRGIETPQDPRDRPDIKNGSFPEATMSGSGVSGGSCDTSSSRQEQVSPEPALVGGPGPRDRAAQGRDAAPRAHGKDGAVGHRGRDCLASPRGRRPGAPEELGEDHAGTIDVFDQASARCLYDHRDRLATGRTRLPAGSRTVEIQTFLRTRKP